MRYSHLSFKKKLFRIFIVIYLINGIYSFSKGFIKGWDSVDNTEQTIVK